MTTDLKIEKKKLDEIFIKLENSGVLINPQSVAHELAIPKNLIYLNSELLEYIYKRSSQISGPDELILKLLKANKSLNKKLDKSILEIKELKASEEKRYKEAFIKGASINYSQNPTNKSKILIKKHHKEIWAKGILQIALEEKLNEKLIKIAYRKLISILHPDKSGQKTELEIENLKKAQKILLECLEVH